MRPALVTRSQWIRFNLYFLLEHFIGLTLSKKLIHPLRKKLYAEALQNPGMKDRGEVYDIKEIERYEFTPELIEQAELLKRPLVFRGVAKDWPAVQKWSKTFFRDHYDKTPVTIIDNPGLVDKEKENVFKHTTFGEYFDEVEKDPSKYLRFSRVLDHNPVLLNDLN